MKLKITKSFSLLICVCMIISGMVISASAAPTEIVFEFGDDNNTGEHDDGSTISAPTSYTNGSYTLTLTSASKCYGGGHDLTGKSALKLGTSGAVGSFTFTVPDDVVSVIFNVAKYKTKASKISINGATTTLTKNFDDGEYDAITIDTTTTKTLNFTTVSGGYRCMINSIIYIVDGTTGGGTTDPEEPDTPVEPEEPDTPTVTGDSYVKVTEAPSDWSGTYLIVYEGTTNGPRALNGGLTTIDANQNGVTVTITDNVIAATDELNSATFTIAKYGSGYSIKSASGKYIGSSSSSSNTLATSASISNATYYTHTITHEGTYIKLVANGRQLQYNSATNTERFRYYSGTQKNLMLYKFAEAKTPVAEMGDTSATVGANLGIQQSITLKTEDAANKTLKMDFTIGDNTTTVDPVITDGNYTFSFNNIPAHFMTEEITATLYVQEGDDKVEQGTNKYTIAEYGKAILESADYTTEVKKFVANMLTYGAAAQKKANHNTGNLATAGLETLISQFGSNEAPSADDKMSLSKTDSDVRFYSANVKFSDVNNLIIKLNAEPGNLKLFVNGVEKTLNGKEYISEDINATDYATKFTFELKDGDTVVQTLTYGINSYAYSMYNKASTSTEMKNLASALYAYGVSASNLK